MGIVLTQVWPTGYYHFVVESLTRLYFVAKERPELLRNRSVFFHTGWGGYTRGWVEMLGIQASQLVHGNVTASEVVWPRSNGCGCVIGDAARWTRQALTNALTSSTNVMSQWAEARTRRSRPTAVLIRRSNYRIINNYAE